MDQETIEELVERAVDEDTCIRVGMKGCCNGDPTVFNGIEGVAFVEGGRQSCTINFADDADPRYFAERSAHMISWADIG